MSLVFVGLVAIGVLVYEAYRLLNPPPADCLPGSEAAEDLPVCPRLTVQAHDLLESFRKGDALAGDTVMNLSAMGPPALSALLDAVFDRNAEVAGVALDAVALLGRQRRLGSEGARATESLTKLIHQASGETRFRAILALGFAGRSRVYAIPELIAALDDKSSAVRAGAARVLGKIGSPAWSATAPLEALTCDPNAFVRQQAEVALDRINPVLTEHAERGPPNSACRVLKDVAPR